MREQLIKYIDLLFAGAKDADDIKQEILQNTLDRYDDLLSQGKTPESAYSLAISGIGDITEILSGNVSAGSPSPSEPASAKRDTRNAKLCRTAAIMFFILCPIPVIILESVLGLCLLLAMVAAGVGLLVFFGKEEPETKEPDNRSNLHKILDGITWGCGLALYFWLSFSTGAWYITWLMFPVIGFVCRMIAAIFDLNKNFVNALVRVILFGLLAAVLSVVLFASCLSVKIFNGPVEGFISQMPLQDGISSSSGSVPAEKVENVQIQWVSGSITVVPGDVSEIQFSESGSFSEKDSMIWKHANGTLEIQFSKPTIIPFESNVTLSKDLVVTFPRDWFCKELDIDSVSAKIQVQDIRAGELELVNVSGNCEFTGCTVTDFSAETVSGGIHYEGTLRELDFDTVSANCTAVLLENPEYIEMDAVSGDLKLILPENCGFTLKLDSLSGDFISDFSTTSSKDRHVYGDGACKIKADSVSGNISIRKP